MAKAADVIEVELRVALQMGKQLVIGERPVGVCIDEPLELQPVGNVAVKAFYPYLPAGRVAEHAYVHFGVEPLAPFTPRRDDLAPQLASLAPHPVEQALAVVEASVEDGSRLAHDLLP